MHTAYRDHHNLSIANNIDEIKVLKGLPNRSSRFGRMTGIRSGRWSAIEEAQNDIKELDFDGFMTKEYKTSPGSSKISREDPALNIAVWKDEQFVPLFDDMKFGPGTEIKPVDALSRIKRTDVFTTSAERTKELRREAMGIGTGDSQDEKALIAAERMLDILRK